MRLISDASVHYLSKDAQLGGVVQLVPADEPLASARNVLGHWSKRAGALHDSTASAELAAIKLNLTLNWRAVALAKELYGDRLSLVICGDNSAAVQQAIAGAARNGGTADSNALYLNQEARHLDASFRLIGTKEMLADCLTKWLSGKQEGFLHPHPTRASEDI